MWVSGHTLYVGHMRAPIGTSVVDIADPCRPHIVAQIEIPAGWHSHKVRVADGLTVRSGAAI